MKARLILGGLTWLALAPACGWRSGLAPPAGARSVGVLVFDAEPDVLERGLEPLLADELTRAVVDLVGAPIARPHEADVVVRGRIEEYRRRWGVRSTRNELLETAVLVVARAELVDRATGRVVVPPRQARIFSGYVLGRDPLALDPVVNEARARERALRHVAETLVLELFGGPSLPVPPPLPPGVLLPMADDAPGDSSGGSPGDGDGAEDRAPGPRSATHFGAR